MRNRWNVGMRVYHGVELTASAAGRHTIIVKMTLAEECVTRAI